MTSDYEALSARQRQIMDAVHRSDDGATVAEIREELPDPPSESAVRTMLLRLEDAGYLRHVKEGRRNRYHPTGSKERARDSALSRLLDTFYRNSPIQAVAAILDRSADELTEEELSELEEMVREAREER
ncbi:MAG: BlaI/MecI/CopY family transcriptional regulator [Candidatus Palauibacterales bacterium]|nr:BlaI/MecI/CopY family transcriptional regulator [Candidatus Palauibacterales bacterium]